MKRILIIAEAGVNHNGSEEIAFQLVDEAAKAGADIVKFQTFKTENLVTQNAQKAEYQKANGAGDESQFAMLKKLELSHETHKKLVAHCHQKNIGFLSTPFDASSLDFLVNDLGLSTLKIPSGEITNAPLLLKYGQSRCRLIVSTGMASLAEVESALGVLAFGLIHSADKTPDSKTLRDAYFSEQGQKALQAHVSLLHCTTEYPAPLEDINLCAMDTLHTAFGLATGYSDHTEGIAIATAAAARGATIIEKHFTLDKSMPGPDHKASLDPGELAQMVQAIRAVEVALGDGLKGPRPSELGNMDVARKSLVASRNIKSGEYFSEDNIAIKRPGLGISPMRYWELLGHTAKRDFNAGDLIDV